MSELLDYATLRAIWWVLICVLLIGFAITDGFDIGMQNLLPFLGKNNTERRIMINTVAPHWDGNQVWLLTGGGAVFAAWPTVYGMSFSGFFIAMVLVLSALFFRPLAFDYRSKIESPVWRSVCDWALFVSGVVPAIVFGVAFGNLLQGVPFEFNAFKQMQYHGTFWQLLNPFALLCGVLSFAMLTTQGATWLQMKTTSELRNRARNASQLFALISLVLFVLGGVWLSSKAGYVITNELDHNAPSVLTNKTVAVLRGAWFNNFTQTPALWIVPALAVLGSLITIVASRANRSGWSFFGSSIMQVGIIFTAASAMFPFIMPSSSHPNLSLTMWDATASHITLGIMFTVTMILVPILLIYTIWAYIKMYGRLDEKSLENNHSAY